MKRMKYLPDSIQMSLFHPNSLSHEHRVQISHALRDIAPNILIGPNEGEFDCYTDENLLSSELPDVFSVDSMFLPHLIDRGLIQPISSEYLNSLCNPQELFDFTKQSCQFNNQWYGVPMFVHGYITMQHEFDKNIHSVQALAEKHGYDSIVFPDMAASSSMLMVRSFALDQQGSTNAKRIQITRENFPLSKADEISQPYLENFRTILNATKIVSAHELVDTCRLGECIPHAAYIGRLENVCGLKSKFEQGNWTLSILPLLEGKSMTTTVSVIVFNANLKGDRLKQAMDYLKGFFTMEKVDEMLEHGLMIPCDKSRIRRWSEKSSIYRDVINSLESVESDIINIELHPDLDNREIVKMSNILKPHLQHIAVSTLRCLTADMVEKAKSGHPGMPIGMSTIAFALWKYFYRASGKDPTWINRDRFVLSNGHGCALQYALLYLTGYETMTLEELQKLRTLDSRTPGHPEWFHTDGVDATTGPLGQGICNSIGMAIAECHLSKRFNRNDLKLFDHYTYVFCGDGDLMEGMSTEGMSFAGHQQLNKLIVFYDDNRITIDGSTDLTFTQDTAMVARGLGWHVIVVRDADSNLLEIKEAIATARLVTNKPSMIICKTTIGYATKQEGTAKAHGSALGEESVKMLKKFCGFNPDDHFIIPKVVRDEFDKISHRNAKILKDWNEMTQKYAHSHKKEWEMLMRMRRGEIEDSLEKYLPKFEDDKAMATRMCSHEVLNSIIKIIPAMVGGSADLTPSNLTDIEGQKDFQPHCREGRYFRFGVREHGMCSISNGILYHGLLRTYVGTFLNFASYGLGAIRLSSLAQLPNIFVLTHDSIGLGEDGPTHQPIEVLSALRAIPNMNVIRPADGRETSGAYLSAITTLKTPTCIALSRQTVPSIRNSSIEKTLKGAYILEDDQDPDVILVATGSEVQLIVEAKKELNEKRQCKVRTVSMPSWELFENQSISYRQEIFSSGIPVLSVEAASVQGWSKYSHHQIGMLNFGASGKYTDIFEKNKITTSNIVELSIKLMNRYKKSAPNLILPPLNDERAL